MNYILNTGDDPYKSLWNSVIKGAVPSLDENLPSFSPLFETIKNAGFITGWGNKAPKILLQECLYGQMNYNKQMMLGD